MTYRCITCKSSVDSVQPPPFSDNFSSWSVLSDGDGICTVCNDLIKDKRARMSMWLMENDGKKITFFKRDRISEFLEAEKTTPFILYLTETYKTQGFLNILPRKNYSNEKFIIGFDRDVIPIDMKHYDLMRDTIRMAREKRFTKNELLTMPHTNRWEDRELCETIMRLKQIPMWRVMVYADSTTIQRKEEKEIAV